ncbi:MAG TPA: FAD-dependent oxidoreductase [Ramlibacter sp.]|nr:FAD-dependent oxidoreductase [Ramlibacter sp.]
MTRSSEMHSFDVVVVGSGAGALLTAIRAVDEGLSALVVEKTGLVGGTSAVSGGGIWVPDNHDMPRHGLFDSVAAAFRYARACARGLASDDRILAYVETAREMAQYLQRIGVLFRAMPRYADYYPHIEHAMPGGRTMDPADFDAARLGVEAQALVRDTNPGQKILGRMLIDSFEARSLIAREPGAMRIVLRLLRRYWLDLPWRLRTRRDRRMTGGQALVGGLFAALRERRIPLWRDSPMQSLLMDEDGVNGVVVLRDGKPVSVHARKAVMLAAGGFERNQAMRERYLPRPTDQAWTATPVGGNTGDAIEAGARAGGALHLMEHTWGVPTLAVPGEAAYRGVFVERSMPGCMVVNARGQRFVDESCPYPEFQQAMFADHARTGGGIPAWIVFDADFRRNYPIGPLLPGRAVPDRKLPPQWLGTLYWRDDTLQGLARRIGVDPQGLVASAARMTAFARSGRDLEFGRGGNVFDRYYGDDSVGPNPNLAPIARGPFYAVQLHPGDIGTKGGLLTDRDARVLDAQGAAIPGLYSVGNNAASVMGPSYPGAGSTLGPALTFAYRAVAHITGHPLHLMNTDLLAEAAVSENESAAVA